MPGCDGKGHDGGRETTIQEVEGNLAMGEIDEEMDREIAKIEEGDAWSGDDEVVEVQFKKPLDKVIPVRLSAEKWEQIREEARELGVGPTTLARMWILERLRQRIKA